MPPKHNLFFKKLLLILLGGFSLSAMAQEKIIQIVKDNPGPFLQQIEEQLKKEIGDLMIARYSITYRSFDQGEDLSKSGVFLDGLYANKGADLIIALGVTSSQQIDQRSSHSVPSIATMVFGNTERPPMSSNRYIFSRPYGSMDDVIQYFSQVFEIQTIGVNGFAGISENYQTKDGITVKVLLPDVKALSDDIQGILLVPQAFKSESELIALIEKANQQHIPTFSVTTAHLEFGCTASIQDQDIMNPLIKKAAINSLYFFENKQAEEMVYAQDTEDLNLVLNMESVKRIQKLPNEQFLESAIMVNLSQHVDVNLLTLEETIAIGISNKLSIQKSQLAIERAEQEQRQAIGNFLPNVSVGAQSIWLSDNIVAASLGQKGALTVTGNATLSQVLFAEPLLANLTLKKLLAESTKERTQQAFLDDIVSITHRYISVLLAKANLHLQNENLTVTRSNLSVATNMEEQGMAIKSDVNRWLSELNLNKVQLSKAEAKYEKTIFELNEVINQPISTKYNFPDSIDFQTIFKFPEEIIDHPLRNQLLLDKLADFYVEEMINSAPELKVISFSEEINYRKRQTAQRSFYLPQLVGFASASDILSLQGLQPNPQLPVPPPPQDPTWSAGVSLNISVLDNRSRSTNAQLAKINEQETAITRQEVENVLESKLRAQVHQLRSSYLSVGYALNAEKSADANFQQAQNAYQQGFITVADVLEAQLAKFNANLLNVQTRYQLAIDYLMLERLTGSIQLLNTSEEQTDYSNRLKQFLWEQ